MTPPIAACLNHPTREAIGICVKCRASLCSECANKLDGVNHCAACMYELARPQAVAAPAPRIARMWVLGAAVGHVLALSVLVWGLLTLVTSGEDPATEQPVRHTP